MAAFHGFIHARRPCQKTALFDWASACAALHPTTQTVTARDPVDRAAVQARAWEDGSVAFDAGCASNGARGGGMCEGREVRDVVCIRVLGADDVDTGVGGFASFRKGVVA